MRILQLCNKPPLPKIDGGCIAIYNISSGLLKVNEDLHILTISTDKHPFLQEEYPQEFIEKTKGNTLESSIYKTIYDELSNTDHQIEIIKEFPKPEIHRRNTGSRHCNHRRSA